MSDRVFPRGIWKSLFLFILSQLGIAILLYHEGSPLDKVFWWLTLPVILTVVFLVYVGDDSKFAGFFFYWLGFLMAASIKAPLPAKIYIFVGSPALWLLVYSDLKNVHWTLLLERILNMGKIVYLLLLILVIVSLVGINYKLLTISGASMSMASLIICEIIPFMILYKLANSQNEAIKKKIIKLTPWIYVFMYIQLVPTAENLWIELLLPIVGSLAWAFLLILVVMHPQAGKDS